MDRYRVCIKICGFKKFFKRKNSLSEIVIYIFLQKEGKPTSFWSPFQNVYVMLYNSNSNETL